MAASDFFARWSKAEPAGEHAGVVRPVEHIPAAAVATDSPVAPPRMLTLEDAAALTTDADFTPFMASHVDAGVKRLALKQLFADPRFNVMDGLDTYIEDYNRFVPMDAAMVAALNHGKALLDPLGHLLQPLGEMTPATPPAPPAGPAQSEPVVPGAPVADALDCNDGDDGLSQTGEPAEAVAAAPPVSLPDSSATAPPSGSHVKSLPGL